MFMLLECNHKLGKCKGKVYRQYTTYLSVIWVVRQMITSEIQMTINIEAILLGAFVAKGGLVQF